MEIKQIRNEEEEVIFTNWTDETFVGHWDFSKNRKEWVLEGITEKKPLGHSFYMPFYLAEHFARQITSREINKLIKKETEKEIKKMKTHLDYYQRLKFNQVIEERFFSDKKLWQDMMDKFVPAFSEDKIENVTRVVLREAPEEEVRLLIRDLRNAEIEEKTGEKTDYNREAVKISRQSK